MLGGMTKTIHEGLAPNPTPSTVASCPASGGYKAQLRAQRRLCRALKPPKAPRKNPHNRELGLAGEELAAEFLQTQGYQVLDRNWRCHAGEVDIVALSPDSVLAFVEVKTRSTRRHGTPAEAITYAKLARMRCVMGAWFRVHEAPFHHDVSLDLVSVEWDGVGQAAITHRKKLK